MAVFVLLVDRNCAQLHTSAGNKLKMVFIETVLKTRETAQVDKKQGKLRVNYLSTWLAEGEE